MIITKESDIFQKLLKDVEDIKIKLNPYTNYYVGCDPIEEKKEFAPVFKAGDWVVRVIGKPSMGRETGRIFRIASTQGSQVYAEDKTSHFSSSLRLASEEEIHGYLLREAIRRGLTAWSRFKWEGEVASIIAGGGYDYHPEIDALSVCVSESEFRRYIYKRGKWATPVFTQEPPRTIAELERLFRDFASQYYGSDLYSERDSEIEKFLRAKGYK